LPDIAEEPWKRLVGFQKVDLMPGASQSVTVVVDSAASNHPLSYFQPDPNGTWADGNWIMPSGNYTVNVGSSSSDTPLEETVSLNAVPLRFTLQLTPGTLSLSSLAQGRLNAVLSLAAPNSLLDLKITNVRFEGVPALTTSMSADGRSLTAIFDGSRLGQLATGSPRTVSLAADMVVNGTPDKLWVSTTAAVVR
jgi:hypothetical protein